MYMGTQKYFEVCLFNECVCSIYSWYWMCFAILQKMCYLHLIALMDVFITLLKLQHYGKN